MAAATRRRASVLRPRPRRAAGATRPGRAGERERETDNRRLKARAVGKEAPGRPTGCDRAVGGQVGAIGGCRGRCVNREAKWVQRSPWHSDSRGGCSVTDIRADQVLCGGGASLHIRNRLWGCRVGLGIRSGTGVGSRWRARVGLGLTGRVRLSNGIGSWLCDTHRPRLGITHSANR